MKTQAECWKALLDGKTLTHKGYLRDCKLDSIGNLVNDRGNKIAFSFDAPENWSIKPETKTITKKEFEKAIHWSLSPKLVDESWEAL